MRLFVPFFFGWGGSQFSLSGFVRGGSSRRVNSENRMLPSSALT